MRYNAFFLECSCAVLLYDSLWHRYKFSHNLEYINAALQCMSQLIPGEPVTSAMNSTQQILSFVKCEIDGSGSIPSQPSSDRPHESESVSDTTTHALSADVGAAGVAHHDLTRPSIAARSAADYAIYMTDGIEQAGQDILLSDNSFDIFTTNLCHFFPLHPPLDQSVYGGSGSCL